MKKTRKSRIKPAKLPKAEKLYTIKGRVYGSSAIETIAVHVKEKDIQSVIDNVDKTRHLCDFTSTPEK